MGGELSIWTAPGNRPGGRAPLSPAPRGVAVRRRGPSRGLVRGAPLGEARARLGLAPTLARHPEACQCAPMTGPDERWPRVILHADMDAFFAAVEQLDHPELRGRPLLIGGTGRRGVVSTASYEARPYGVGSAMPMARARRLCPDAIVLAPNFHRYSEVSKQIMAVFADFSPKVEPLSVDEAFLDMTGAEGLFGPPEAMGRRLKAAVYEATGGLTVSVGLSTTKYVAKVASDFDKPDGLTVVPPEAVRRFLAPLPVTRLWGVGPKSEPRLRALGFDTVGDVAAADPERLVRALGSFGAHLSALARGDDPREVISHHEAKSIGSEVTLEEDIVGVDAVRRHLRREADTVAYRLRQGGLRARGVRVKIRTAAFRLLTRQLVLREGVDSADALVRAADRLLPELPLDVPMRLVGIAAFHLEEGAAVTQMGLFDEGQQARSSSLDRTLDALRSRFGKGVVRRGDDVEE